MELTGIEPANQGLNPQMHNHVQPQIRALASVENHLPGGWPSHLSRHPFFRVGTSYSCPSTLVSAGPQGPQAHGVFQRPVLETGISQVFTKEQTNPETSSRVQGLTPCCLPKKPREILLWGSALCLCPAGLANYETYSLINNYELSTTISTLFYDQLW